MKKNFLVLMLIWMVVSCASKEEKIERAQNAFDLEGSYAVTQGAQSEIGMNYNVRNESGRNDIIIYINERTPLHIKEINLLKKHSVNEADIFEHFFTNPLELGRGKNSGTDWEGGDNISDDFGNSSKFYVCSPEHNYSKDITIHYCMNGVAKKSEKSIIGGLTLFLKKKTIKVENGQNVESEEIESVVLNFKNKEALNFYKQYLGIWRQDYLYSTDAVMGKLLESLVIAEKNVSEGVVSVMITPSYFLKEKNLNFAGKKYIFDQTKHTYKLADFIDHDPIDIQFTLTEEDPKGLQKLHFTGQIWSLGNFSGEVQLVNEKGEFETVGIVRYFKKN